MVLYTGIKAQLLLAMLSSVQFICEQGVLFSSSLKYLILYREHSTAGGMRQTAAYINIVTLCNFCVGAWSLSWELMQINALF